MKAVNSKAAWYLHLGPAVFGLNFCGGAPRADRIFVNGHVMTMNEDLPEAEGFALKRGDPSRTHVCAQVHSCAPRTRNQAAETKA